MLGNVSHFVCLFFGGGVGLALLKKNKERKKKMSMGVNVWKAYELVKGRPSSGHSFKVWLNSFISLQVELSDTFTACFLYLAFLTGEMWWGEGGERAKKIVLF